MRTLHIFPSVSLCKSKRFPILLASRLEASQQLSRQEALRTVERLLRTGKEQDELEAVKLMTDLRERGLVYGFGRGRQVPKRQYSLDELRLNKIEPEKYLSPRDNTLNSVRTILQCSAGAGLLASYAAGWMESSALFSTVFAALFLLSLDQVLNQGGVEALVVDSAGRVLSSSYSERVALHEAGHFLVAYLLGLLPRSYTLSSLDAFMKTRALNVQAGTQFCDAAFQREVKGGRMSSNSLEAFCCVALAGVATEYIRFGKAEGGLADVQQLDAMMRALGFSSKKVEGEVRWAVLSSTLMLRRHRGVQDALAAAMSAGKSVGECIAVIEDHLHIEDLMPVELHKQ